MEDIKIDRAQAFQLFAVFCGDVEKVAHAIGLRPVDVLRVADEENWLEKLKPILDMKKSARPGDVERGINRALNFVQALRMTQIVERVINKITGLSPEELNDYLFTDHSPKTGDSFKKLTTRALADLASAMEKAQAMTYQALNDTAQDRNRRKEQEESPDDAAAAALHVQIASGMAKVRESGSPRALLFDAQLSRAQEQVEAEKKSSNPYDRED